MVIEQGAIYTMGSVKGTYKILRRALLTEKTATVGSTANAVVFEVHPGANKIEIKAAVEEVFKVKVRAIRTVNCLGKLKRVGTSTGYKRDCKKAYIYLQEGSSIDVVEGL